ncbi:MAG: uridine kinase [Saprospiraceae bacterium]|nr:uridine kinase [Saprospiraceae bacterium]
MEFKKPFIIGLTGGSGSGKTTFIKYVRKSFSPTEVCIVSQDDYYKPREEQEVDSNGFSNFDLPNSIDKKQFIRDVKDLMEGKSICIKEYNFNNPLSDPNLIHIQSAPIIIVEGIFVFHYRKMRKMMDLRVFFHAKENLKVIRRIKRDKVERNYPIDDVLYRYEHHVLPSFEKYILPYKEKADIIINNNNNFDAGLEVFVGYLKSKLLNNINITNYINEQKEAVIDEQI